MEYHHDIKQLEAQFLGKKVLASFNTIWFVANVVRLEDDKVWFSAEEWRHDESDKHATPATGEGYLCSKNIVHIQLCPETQEEVYAILLGVRL
jgi:hypothetical protein